MKKLFGMREETWLLVLFVLSIALPIILPIAWLSFLSLPLFLPEVSEDFELLVLSLACPTTPLMLFVGVITVLCFRSVLDFYAELWKTSRAMRQASGMRLDACRFLVRLFLGNLSRPRSDRFSLSEMQHAVQHCGTGSDALRVRRAAGDTIDYEVYEYRARDFLVAVCPDIAKMRTSKVSEYGAESDERRRGGDQDPQEKAQLANFVGDVTSRLNEQERRQRRARRKKKKNE